MLEKTRFSILAIALSIICLTTTLSLENKIISVAEAEETTELIQSQEKENNILDSVWMVIVPTEVINSKEYLKSSSIGYVGGSAFVVDPKNDPAFADKIFQHNIVTMKQNFNTNNSYLVTNNHVIRHFTENLGKRGFNIKIAKLTKTPFGPNEFAVSETFNVNLRGKHPVYDLAILELENTKLPAIYMGDYEQMGEFYKKSEGGYPITIIGSPHLAEGSIIKGWLYDQRDVVNYFSTYFNIDIDSEVNTFYYYIRDHLIPGNSGGPSVGSVGWNKNKLLGVNTLTIPGEGMGYMIPEFIVKKAVIEMLTDNVHIPCYSGLALTNPSSAKDKENQEFYKKLAERQSYGSSDIYFEILGMQKGALVVGFNENSPFIKGMTWRQEYEIKYGDVITHINGEEIENPKDFFRKLRSVITEKIEIKIVRFSPNEEKKYNKEEIVVEKKREELTSNFAELAYGSNCMKTRKVTILGTEQEIKSELFFGIKNLTVETQQDDTEIIKILK